MGILIDGGSFRKFCTSESLTILALTAKLSINCPILDKSAFMVRSMGSVARTILSSATEDDEVELELKNNGAGLLSVGEIMIHEEVKQLNLKHILGSHGLLFRKCFTSG